MSDRQIRPDLAASGLLAELDLWAADGRKAHLWWRDDDAARPMPALDRLLDLSGRSGLPLSLAVIPATASGELAAALSGLKVTVLQHGYRHLNHALPGERAVECGGYRSTEAVLSEFRKGRDRLRDLFGERFVPVMVPPWNRIGSRIVETLAGEGYRGLSVFGPAGEWSRPALPEVNAHLDLLTWKGGARFAGRDKVYRLLVERLRARREGNSVQFSEPLGILTHHLDHDEASWACLGELLGVLAAHPAVVWRDAKTLFAGEASRAPA